MPKKLNANDGLSLRLQLGLLGFDLCPLHISAFWASAFRFFGLLIPSRKFSHIVKMCELKQ